MNKGIIEMKENEDKKKGHAAGYAIFLLVAIIVILALLAGVFVTSSVLETGHEHSWDDGVETAAATCEDMGTMTYTCKTCGDTKEEATAPLGHDWESEYTEATCSTAGYTTQVCSRCGATQAIDGGAATDIHSYVESTDEEDGYVAATCTEGGTKVEICSVCGDIRTSDVEALGHDYVESTDEEDGYVAETCGTDGTSVLKCTRCDSIVTATVSATGNHSWDWSSGTVTVGPGCVENGEIEYTCSECGKTIIGTILPLGHKYEEDVWSWTAEGDGGDYDVSASLDFVCSICGETATVDAFEVTSNDDGTYTAKAQDPYGMGEYEGTGRAFAEPGDDGVVTDVGTGAIYTPQDGDGEIASYELTSVSSGTTDLYIAGYVNGYPVSVADNLLKNDKTIQTVVFEDGVTEIGSSSFYGCTGITSVEIPGSVTTIGTQAFSGCTGITSLTIEDGVSVIGPNSFNGCKGLSSLELPSSVILIDYRGFYQCSNLESVVIHGNDTMTDICGYSFYECTQLKTLTIEGGTASIGNQAFYKCTSLESVKIYANLYSVDEDEYNVCAINDKAFSNCTALTTLIISGDIAIGSSTNYCVYSSAFNSCSLSTVYFEGTEEQWATIKDAINSVNSTTVKWITESCAVYYYSAEYSEDCWHLGEDGMPVLWTEDDKTYGK